MIVTFIIRLIQMLVLVALQVLVCNHIHLFGYATPMLYVLFLAYLPLDSNRIANLCWAFVMGLLIDVFSNTPGEASASLTLAAFVQWPLLHALVPKESVEDMVPNYRTMGKWNHIRYLFVLTAVHHVAFYLLESFSFFNPIDALISLGSSFALSFVLILVIETMRGRKSK